MKRSRQVTLILMGLGAVGLAGCGESKEQVFVYQNPKQCVADKRGDQKECDMAFLRAQGEHFDKAPRYEAKADCEREFGEGKCEERRVNNGGSGSRMSFVPLMVGYMMGRAGATAMAPQPLYQFKGQNNFRTPAGGTIPGAAPGAQPYGARTVAPSNLATATRPVTVSRGGFGATAMSVAHSSRS